MGSNSLNPCFTKIEPISHPKGDLYKIITKNSENYIDFGEAYFTSIKQRETKGWKKHRVMYLNLTVPVGNVKFHVLSSNLQQRKEYTIGQGNYGSLFIPPDYWVAFTGIGESFNLVLNIASIEHDPDESENISIHDFPIQI